MQQVLAYSGLFKLNALGSVHEGATFAMLVVQLLLITI